MSYIIKRLDVKENSQPTIEILDLLTDDNVRELSPVIRIQGNIWALQYHNSEMSFTMTNDDKFKVNHISVKGARSGHVFEELFIPLLKKSGGEFKFIMVPSLDTMPIEKINISNGYTTREEIV